MTTLRRLALIAALALVPILPYVLLGYTGQDLPFHVCSWLDLRDGWLAGRLNPGWSAAAKYGHGDPHLTFYPPVSYFIGASLISILPLRLAPAAFAWIALVLSGAAMYASSRPFVADRDRLAAATVYMLGPYTVTCSLVRFAAAELLVMAWLPLIALCFYEAVWMSSLDVASEARHARRRALILLGLLLGLSWITNIPASIVLVYTLLPAAFLAAVRQRSVTPLLRILFAEALAAAFAGFHLLPAWRERAWIHSNALLSIDPLQLLLFMPHRSFTDGPLLIVCWIFLCVQTALVIACLRRRTLPLAADPAVLFWAALAGASFLLQSPLAIPFWLHAPELRFVQFPWRFLAILGVAVPLLLLGRGTRASLRRPAYILTAALCVMPFLGYLSEQAVAANRAPPLPQLLAAWRRMGAPEYLPAGALTPAAPTSLLSASSVDLQNPLAADPSCTVHSEQESPALRTFQTSSPAFCRIRLTIYFYPYWHASDESGRQLPTLRDTTGFLLINVPPGTHTISLAFRPSSPARTASAIVSLLALLISGVLLLLIRRPAPRRGRTQVPSAIP